MLTGVRLNPIGRLVRFVAELPASVSEYLTQQETTRIATKRLNEILEAAYVAQIKTIHIINSHGNYTRVIGVPANPESISIGFHSIGVSDVLSIINFFGLDEEPKKRSQKEFELRSYPATVMIEYSLEKTFSSSTLVLRLTFSSPSTDQPE